jgi:hypothetical protein
MFFFRRLCLAARPLVRPPRARDYIRDAVVALALGSYFRARRGLETGEGVISGDAQGRAPGQC